MTRRITSNRQALKIILGVAALGLSSWSAPAQTLSIADARVNEGARGGRARLTFVVTLSAASDSKVTVSWATSSGTATGGHDDATTSAQLTFAPGVRSQNIVIVVVNDHVDEPLRETFSVTLSNPSAGVTLARAQATGTIVDDDRRDLVLSRTSLALTEAGVGRKATYTVALHSQPTPPAAATTAP